MAASTTQRLNQFQHIDMHSNATFKCETDFVDKWATYDFMSPKCEYGMQIHLAS